MSSSSCSKVQRRAFSLLLTLSATILLAGCEDNVIDLAVSPGGRSVAYTTEKSGLIILDTVTSKTQSLEVGKLRPGGLAWAPSSGQLVFVSQREETSSWDLTLLDVLSGTREVVAEHAAREFDPAFSPDGRWLYFCSTRTGGSDIYRYDASTGEIAAFVTEPYDQVKPRPSASGAKLAYLSYENGSPSVRIVSTSESGTTSLDLSDFVDEGGIQDLRWVPGSDEELIVHYGDPARSLALRFNLLGEKTVRLLRAGTPVSSLTPLSRSSIAYVADGEARIDSGRLRPSKALLKAGPAEQSLLDVDAVSGVYALVIGQQFVVTGRLETRGYHIWLTDEEQGGLWAVYLAKQERNFEAIAQLRGIIDRLKSDPGKADDVRLQLAALLRDNGLTEEGIAVAHDVSRRPAFDQPAQERRGQAARALAEMYLFDLGNEVVAAQWFGAATDALSPEEKTICHPQRLLADLDPDSVTRYRRAVRGWRANAYSRAAKDFERLLADYPRNESVLSEALSVFSENNGENFQRLRERDAMDDLVTRDSIVKHQARVARAYVAAGGENRREALSWLCVARYAVGDVEKSRDCARELLSMGIGDEMSAMLIDLLAAYLTDAGEPFRRGWVPADERRAKAFLDGFIEEVVLSPAVKDDLIFTWPQDASPALQLIPELAEMRQALRHGDQMSVLRQQRFVVGDLLRVADSKRDEAWRMLAVLTSGMSAEAHMRLGNWLDARQACERALEYETREGEDNEMLLAYQEQISERLALLFSGAEAQSAFASVMEVERNALSSAMLDPVDLHPTIWTDALRGYVALMRQPGAQPLRPVIYYLMADAYAASGQPDGQIVAALQAALASDPLPQLKAVIDKRLRALHEGVGDPYLAERVADGK